jgi:hypothetical protein
MKKAAYLLIISLVLVLVTHRSFSQEADAGKDYKFTIKTNPLTALGGPLYVLYVVPLTAEYKLSFEAKTFAKQSVQITAGYLGNSPLVSSLGDLDSDTTIKSSGFHGQLLYKIFLTQDEAPNGFYVGPHVSYAFAKVMNSEVHTNYFTVSKLQIHVALGYQLITKGGFALDIFTGIGVKNKGYDLSHLGGDSFFADWKLNNKFTVSIPFGFNFGYAF